MKGTDPRYFLGNFSDLVDPVKMIRSAGNKLIFPFYHAVNNQPGAHLRNLYPVKTEAEFMQDITKLLELYQPLSPEVLLKNDQDLRKPGFILSFDDGLREIKEVIAPILLKKGISAIFFLNNDFIDNRDLFYRYKASIIIDSYKNREKNKKLVEAVKSITKKRRISPGYVQRFILGTGYGRKNDLEILGAAADINFSEYLKKTKPYLTAKEISSLISQGFYIGAHSNDHQEFFRLGKEEQFRGVLNSVRDIKERFKLDYGFFAFPFTDYGVSEEVLKRLVAGKKREVDAVFGTAGMKKEKPYNHFQRLSMEKYPGNSEKIIKTEILYFLIKKGLGI